MLHRALQAYGLGTIAYIATNYH